MKSKVISEEGLEKIEKEYALAKGKLAKNKIKLGDFKKIENKLIEAIKTYNKQERKIHKSEDEHYEQLKSMFALLNIDFSYEEYEKLIETFEDKVIRDIFNLLDKTKIDCGD